MRPIGPTKVTQAIGVTPPQVARMPPAAAKATSVDFITIPIAQMDAGAPSDDLSSLSHCNVAILTVDDTNFSVRCRSSRGATTAFCERSQDDHATVSVTAVATTASSPHTLIATDHRLPARIR